MLVKMSKLVPLPSLSSPRQSAMKISIIAPAVSTSTLAPKKPESKLYAYGLRNSTCDTACSQTGGDR